MHSRLLKQEKNLITPILDNGQKNSTVVKPAVVTTSYQLNLL